MTDSKHETTEIFHGELPPLDDFEQQWTRQLARPETDLLADRDEFVANVMQRVERTPVRTVLARIGSWKPLAAAAAVVLAALIGWQVFNQAPTPPQDKPLAADPPAPILADSAASPVTPPAKPRPEDVQVGQLINQFSTSFAEPQLSVVPNDHTPPRLQRLLQLFDNPVPDPSRFLPERAGAEQG